jgi:hypothetical protein
MEGPSLNLPRCGLGVCTSDGKIYAFGGWVGSQLGDSIEMYDSNRGDLPSTSTTPHANFGLGIWAYSNQSPLLLSYISIESPN